MSFKAFLKSKRFVYLASIVVAFAATVLTCSLVFDLPSLYTAHISLLTCLLALAAARIIFALATKTAKANVIISEAWLIFACAALFVCIRTASMSAYSLFLWLVGLGLINAIGFTFLCSEIRDLPITKVDDYIRLKAGLKFRFVGDELDGKPDLNQPLIVVDGVPRSADEAEKMGYGAKAADALEYIKMILKK